MTRYHGKARPPGSRRRAPRGTPVRVDAPRFEVSRNGVRWWYRGRHGFLVGAGPGCPCVCGDHPTAWYVCTSCRSLLFDSRGPLVRQVLRAPTLAHRYQNRHWTTADEKRIGHGAADDVHLDH